MFALQVWGECSMLRWKQVSKFPDTPTVIMCCKTFSLCRKLVGYCRLCGWFRAAVAFLKQQATAVTKGWESALNMWTYKKQTIWTQFSTSFCLCCTNSSCHLHKPLKSVTNCFPLLLLLCLRVKFSKPSFHIISKKFQLSLSGCYKQFPCNPHFIWHMLNL